MKKYSLPAVLLAITTTNNAHIPTALRALTRVTTQAPVRLLHACLTGNRSIFDSLDELGQTIDLLKDRQNKHTQSYEYQATNRCEQMYLLQEQIDKLTLSSDQQPNAQEQHHVALLRHERSVLMLTHVEKQNAYTKQYDTYATDIRKLEKKYTELLVTAHSRTDKK